MGLNRVRYLHRCPAWMSSPAAASAASPEKRCAAHVVGGAALLRSERIIACASFASASCSAM